MARPRKRLEIVRELTPREKIDDVKRAFFVALQMEETLDLDDWCDKYVKLPRETSSEFGEWSTNRFPFLRRIMKCLSPSSGARQIVVMKGAQLGLTTVAINWLLYASHQYPGPCMYMQKTDDAAKDFSTQKLKPSIDACDVVRAILGDDKPKHYANAWDNKAYPGGFIVLGGANSSTFLRSKSVRYVVADEEDTYEQNVSSEGAPVLLVAKRQVTFPDRKLFRLSTPVLDETSTIKQAYLAGTQEKFFVPCPHCNPNADPDGFVFVIAWQQIKWSDERDAQGLPINVWCECPNCAGEIREAEHKTWMLEHGKWYSTRDEKQRCEAGDEEVVSFHISSLYSPFGFFSWRDAVAEFFEYERTKDVNKLQVFVNQTLGETFTLEGHEVSYSWLYKRRETYAADVPQGVLCLTAGVDVQDDRIEVEVVGWGENNESWGIDYAVFPGDTAMLGDAQLMLPDGRPSVWRLLDEYLQRRWRHESGAMLPVEVTMIDSGYKSEEVHTFCRVREGRRVFPIKGKEGWGAGLFSVSRRRHERYGTILYTAHVDELKARLYAHLKVDAPGAGFCHFPRKPCYSEKYFKGLTCETRKVKWVNGKQRLYWHTPSGARNEPIDVRNYATVAFVAYPINLEARKKTGLLSLFPEYGVARGITSVGMSRKKRRGSSGL